MAVAAAAAVAEAGAAAADSSPSGNWAGYAAHGAVFQSVSARWRQPHARCVRGQTRYSAMWVGIGGYSTTSSALEQIGTELDCKADGRVASSAWYELVPAGSNNLRMPVRPGDLMAAGVTVVGQRVTLMLQNLTRRRTFAKTFSPALVDVTSADWILEAPSACVDGTSTCRTLPLTNFGRASFTVARAQVVGGQKEPIADQAWRHTRITLVPEGPLFVSNRQNQAPVGTARPSALINNGSSFRIAYRRQGASKSFGPRSAVSGPTYLRH
jgi:hypothetical protein